MSVPEKSSGFGHTLLLIGVTMLGFAGGPLIFASLWAGSAAQQWQSPVAEDFSYRRPSCRFKQSHTRQARNEPNGIYHAAGIELNAVEPPFPVPSELKENMSPEDVLTNYGQPHLILTQREHKETIQRFVYIDSDLHSTSVIFKEGKIVVAYGSSVHGH